MRVLLIGAGGREHALAWKIVQSSRVTSLTSLPGNPGLATLGETIEGIDPTDAGAVAAVAVQHGFDLVVIGPEAPLAAGVADALGSAGVPVFGPSRSAARLESSKSFAKELMDRAGVPTAAWRRFTTPEPAIEYLATLEAPYVVKADGLAAGKGVLVTDQRADAEDWVRACMDGRFGAAGTTVVIEEYLEGPELSVFAVCDGSSAVMLEPARDYKRLLAGDAGPNTGGMGSYSPVPDLPDDIVAFTKSRVVEPILATMAAEGNPFVGFLYTGYILSRHGPRVLEFNCRLGDPETQVVLPRMQTDLVDLFEGALAGSLADMRLRWSDTAAVNVVLAAPGYPTNPRTGERIKGLAAASAIEDVLVFQAGTVRSESGVTLTAGGRVLNVVGTGPTVQDARRRAYEGVSTLSFQGMQYRPDIAKDPT